MDRGSRPGWMRPWILGPLAVLVGIALLGGALTAASAPARAAQEVSRETAVEIATDGLLGGSLEEVRLYVHPEPVSAGIVVASCKRPVFTAPTAGWFVFIDLIPRANWEHPCLYVFVDAATGELQRHEAQVPPALQASLEEITDGRDNPLPGESEKAHARFDRRLAELPRPEKGLRSRAHALIISGGADASNNHIRYWNDCSFIYKTLVNYYQYPDENIHVCISDGLDPATLQSIGQVFGELAATLGPADQLFIFTTDHGGQQSGWDCYLNLWNWEELRDDQLAGFVDALPCETVLCCFEQCFSGGMIDDLEGEGRVIATAARWDQYSWAMSGLVYDEFVYYWISAVNWADPYGTPVDADTNNDEIVSMEEAFIYARDHDTAGEAPQYSSTPLELGRTSSLIGVYEGVYLAVEEILVDDDDLGASQGNGNGLIEPNETVEISVTLANLGSEDGVGVAGLLTSGSAYVTLLVDEALYGEIPSGGVGYPQQPLVVHVTPDAPDLVDLGLVLESTTAWAATATARSIRARRRCRGCSSPTPAGWPRPSSSVGWARVAPTSRPIPPRGPWACSIRARRSS